MVPVYSSSVARRIRLIAVAAWLVAIAVGGASLGASPASAAGETRPKVVVVVGPVGSKTAHFKERANEVARLAADRGARVIRIYSPYATWARVKKAAQGANMLVYLGHGNGWPSPYGPFQKRTKDGMGLNRVGGEGNRNHKYWGEGYIASEIDLAPNAVVLLMGACYTAGNPEWGDPAPSKSVAKARVDNYGAGFLRAGARVVVAEVLGRPHYLVNGLFGTNKSMAEIFWSAPNAVASYRIAFQSDRTPGKRALMDPNPHIKGTYWRSIIGDLSMRAGAWR